MNDNSDNSTFLSEVHQPRIANDHSPLHNIMIEPDSAVSEKVLLDTVAEKEVMDQVEVSFLLVIATLYTDKGLLTEFFYTQYRFCWKRRNEKSIQTNVNIVRKLFASQAIL